MIRARFGWRKIFFHSGFFFVCISVGDWCCAHRQLSGASSEQRRFQWEAYFIASSIRSMTAEIELNLYWPVYSERIQISVGLFASRVFHPLRATGWNKSNTDYLRRYHSQRLHGVDCRDIISLGFLIVFRVLVFYSFFWELKPVMWISYYNHISRCAHWSWEFCPDSDYYGYGFLTTLQCLDSWNSWSWVRIIFAILINKEKLIFGYCHEYLNAVRYIVPQKYK